MDYGRHLLNGKVRTRGFSEANKILARIIIDPHSGCWIWTGTKDPGGYGSLWLGNRLECAHRASYNVFVGSIPDGMEIDHRCNNPACVQPAHLLPVTARENTLRSDGVTARNARKTHCKRGHPLADENLRIRGKSRWCRKCDVIRSKAHRDRTAEIRNPL